MSEDVTRDRPQTNGGRAVGQLVDSLLKLWPIVVFLFVQTFGIVGWGIKLQTQVNALPTEVPPAWFLREVNDIKEAVEKVDGKVDQNGKDIAALKGQINGLPRFSDK